MSKVYFNLAILEKAKQLFYAVLEKYINDEIADRVYFYQHEMNYSESEAEKYALMY